MDFGSSTAEHVELLSSASGVSMAFLDFLMITLPNNQFFDVRQYQSYYLRINSHVSVSPATKFNMLLVEPFWYTNPQPFSSNATYHDLAELVVNDSAGGTYHFSGQDVYLQDSQHGPYMTVALTNNGTDTILVDYELYGTSRVLSSPFAAQDQLPDGFLVDPNTGSILGLGAGATKRIAANYGYGRVRWRISTTQPFTVNIYAGSLVTAFDSLNSGAAGTFTSEFIAPKRSLIFEVRNSGGVAMNAFLTAIELRDRQ